MYKLKLNNKLINFNPGTRVIDLIDKNEVKQYMVCKINQTIKELTYPLSVKNSFLSSDITPSPLGNIKLIIRLNII